MSDRDDDLIKIAVENSVYHSLNDDVRRNCGRDLPIPYMFYIERKLNEISLHNWMKDCLMSSWDDA